MFRGLTYRTTTNRMKHVGAPEGEEAACVETPRCFIQYVEVKGQKGKYQQYQPAANTLILLKG